MTLDTPDEGRPLNLPPVYSISHAWRDMKDKRTPGNSRSCYLTNHKQTIKEANKKQ